MRLLISCAVVAALAGGLAACGAPRAEAPAEVQPAPVAQAVEAIPGSPLIALLNTSFEGDSERRLPGWIKSEHGGGNSYTFESDSETFHSAPSAARVRRHGPELFGLLSQWVPVDAAWRGKTLKVSAWMKGKDLDSSGRGGGALIIRADRTGGGHAGQNFMEEGRLKGSTEWQFLSVELKIPDLAGTLRVGAMLQGGGTLWVDDLRAEFID